MKKEHLLLLFILISFNLKAQNNCEGYFAHKVGSKFEITTYDKKDKVSTILRYEVLKNTSIPNGVDILFANQTLDSKSREIMKSEFTVKCQAGEIFVDATYIASNMIPNAPNMQVSITGEKLIYPNQMKVGQKLNDGQVEVKTTMQGGITLMNLKIKITNRKVEGFETVETPAGKFECVKISYESETKAGIAGTQITKNIEYLAKGIGLVKFESFDKNGKKISSQQLTKVF
jgi:hypothetical protein